MFRTFSSVLNKESAAILILVLLISAILLEIFSRLIFPLPEYPNFNRINYSPTIIQALNESRQPLRNNRIRYESKPDDASFEGSLNLYGFRDGPWSLASRDPHRVIFVGDSYVEGYLTDDLRTIPKAFEREARSKNFFGQVLNAGVSAAGFVEYGRLLRDLIPLARPRDVILVVFENDFAPTVPYPPGYFDLVSLPHFRPDWHPRSVTLVRQLLNGEPIARAWHGKAQPFFPAVPHPGNPWSRRETSNYLRADIHEAMRMGTFNPFAIDEIALYDMLAKMPSRLDVHLDAIKVFLDTWNCRLTLVYLPYPAHVNAKYLGYKLNFSLRPSPASDAETRVHANTLRTWSDQHGVLFLDLTEPMRAQEASGQLLSWNYDHHFRPEGYVWAGENIFKFWELNNPISETRSSLQN